MAIKIITDSACDLPKSIIRKHNIKIVPLTVNFKEESFLDKFEITTDEFFDKLENAEELPTTSQVSPGEFVSAFKENLGEEDEILGIFLAHELSGTIKSAQMAKDIIGSDKIKIVDSRSVSLGEGILVLKAIDLVNKGTDIDEIVKVLEETTKKVKTAAAVDTLKYLEKGGRLTKKQAVIGSMLKIKPIIELRDGQVLAVDKVRGKKRVIKWIENWIDKNNYDLNNKKIILLNGRGQELHDSIKEILINKYNAEDIIESEIGSVVATHSGPGCAGLAFINE